MTTDYSRDEVAGVYGCTVEELDAAIVAGKFPEANYIADGGPRWFEAVVLRRSNRLAVEQFTNGLPEQEEEEDDSA